MNKIVKTAKISLAAVMMASLGLVSIPAATAQPSANTSTSESQAYQHDAKQGDKDKQAKERLEKLKGTQSQKEIDKIVASDDPATVLIDVATGNVTAAELKDSNAIQPLTYQVGPGCTTTSVCVIGNTYYGFAEPGVISGTWSGAYTFQTGVWTTSLGYKPSTFAAPIYTAFIGPGKTGFFSDGRSVTLTRVSIR
ncbi:hypothetical protein IWX63_003367 [Arthrobacter sp. CAN_A2]|uniref:hypothetical protein n=1 Tax=Arthrobacter sp. CAN_A2 TaxID=2787718 RepID=UPI0018EFDD6E